MQGIDAGSWPLKCCSGYFISSDGVITFLFLLGPPGNLKKNKNKENYYASDSSSRCMIIFCTTLPCATGSGEYYILIVSIFFIKCIPVVGRLVSRTSWQPEEVQREGDLLCFLQWVEDVWSVAVNIIVEAVVIAVVRSAVKVVAVDRSELIN